MSPRSKEASEIMRGKTREAILGASLELFAKRGYSATTTAEIARRAGVSKGLIFTYFRTKQDILYALFDTEFEILIPRFFPENDSRPPEERLRAMVDTWLQLMTSRPLLTRLSLQLNLDDAYRGMLKSGKLMGYFETFLAQLIRTFEELGSPKPKLATFVLIFFFDGVAANYTVAPELFPIEEIKEYLMQLLVAPHKPD